MATKAELEDRNGNLLARVAELEMALEAARAGRRVDCVEFEDGNGFVGRLSWSGGRVVFEGHLASSARVFFERFVEPLILDAYVVRLNGSEG